MSRILEVFRIGKFNQLNFWSEPHPEGKLFYFGRTDVEKVKKNAVLESGQAPSSPDEIVQAATNGLGTLMRTSQDENLIEFFVTEESVPFAQINLTLFADLTEEQKLEI